MSVKEEKISTKNNIKVEQRIQSDPPHIGTNNFFDSIRNHTT